MRKSVRAVLVAASVVAVAAVAAVGLAACGTSESTAQAQTVPANAQGGGTMGDPSSMFTQALDPLVTAGTITNDQEQTVISALSSSMSANAPSGGMQTPPAQPSGGSQPTPGAQPSAGATPPAGMPQGGPAAAFSDALDGLVSDGTITAAQATAIEDALSAAQPAGAPSGQQTGSGVQSGSSSARTY
jgi:hypothetical protein